MTTSTEKLMIESPCPMAICSMSKINGQFSCRSCNKFVTDYRGKSLSEIKQIHQPGACGIFDGDVVESPDFNFSYMLKFAFLTALSILGFNVSPIKAQVKIDTKPEITVTKKTDFTSGKEPYEFEKNLGKVKESPAIQDKKRIFKKKHKKPQYRIMGCPSF